MINARIREIPRPLIRSLSAPPPPPPPLPISSETTSPAAKRPPFLLESSKSPRRGLPSLLCALRFVPRAPFSLKPADRDGRVVASAKLMLQDLPVMHDVLKNCFQPLAIHLEVWMHFIENVAKIVVANLAGGKYNALPPR